MTPFAWCAVGGVQILVYDLTPYALMSASLFLRAFATRGHNPTPCVLDANHTSSLFGGAPLENLISGYMALVSVPSVQVKIHAPTCEGLGLSMLLAQPRDCPNSVQGCEFNFNIS